MRVVVLVLFGLLPCCLGSNTRAVQVNETFNCDPDCPSVHGQTRGGKLTVTILEVTGVEDTDGWGPFADHPDPYLVVQLPGVERRSKPVQDSSNPVWPEGGEDLDLGSQASGEPMTVSLYDFDEGLEWGDDLLAETTVNVLDCSCFDKDEGNDATCTKTECVEEAWVPLREGENCGGRTRWPWTSAADPSAFCLRLRMTIEPFLLQVVEVFEPRRTIGVTTVSVGDAENPAVGNWGRFYQGNNEPLDPSNPKFYGLEGGLMLQTAPLDSNRALPATYATIRTNLDSKVYVFRRLEDFPFLPPWLANETRWENTTYELIRFGDQANIYRAMQATLKANETFELGYPADRLYNDMGEEHENAAMYVVIVVMDISVDLMETPYRTEFEKGNFFPLLIEMLVFTLPFVLVQRGFLRKIAFRMDRIESALLQSASKPESVNLVSLVLRPIYQNGSKANIDFRRNIYFIGLGARIVLWVPVATGLSYSLAMAQLAVPAAAGVAVFCIGLGAAILMYWGVTWKLDGWRMSKSRMRGFALSFTLFYGFLFLSVCYDMRVIDAGMYYSIFCLSCVAFVLNSLPLIFIFFLDNDQLHTAFSQLQKVVNKNSKMNTVKNKFQALGTMGLKMALLNNKAKAQQEDTAAKKGHVNRAFGTLLGSVYTVDDTIEEFKYSDIMRRWFTGSKKKRKRLVWKAYRWSLLILFVYSLIVYFKCDPRFKGQGFGLSFSVIALDVSLFALLRGPCMWSTGNYVMLSFAGRSVLALFSGDNWLIGVGGAYFIYGSALGTEIINQRMRTFDSDRAGAIAYFGLDQGKKKRKHDVSAMPEFVLGVMSFAFLIALLGYVFQFGDEDMPGVTLFGQEWKIWIFGVAAFVIVTVNVVLGLANRALMLQKQNLLNSKTYLYYKSFNMPLQLVALAEVLVVMSGLLVYAMTGSVFIFVSSVFTPLILGACVKVYKYWVSNDFSVFEKPEKRGEQPDDDSDEEEEEEEEPEDDDEDDEDGEEGGTKKKAKKDDSESEEESTEEEDSDDDAVQTLQKSLLGNIKNLKDKGGGKINKLAMPKINFRKPVNLATKVDREFEESDEEEEGQEEEEQKEKENPGEGEEAAEEKTEPAEEQEGKTNDDGHSDSESSFNPEEDEQEKKEASKDNEGESGKPENNNEEGNSATRDGEVGEGNQELDPEGAAEAGPAVEGEGKGEGEGEKKEKKPRKPCCKCPNLSLVSCKDKLVELRHAQPKQAMYSLVETKREKIRAKFRVWLKISDEQDPKKMTDLEAFFNGELTDMDYGMLRAMVITGCLVFFYGLTISLVEGNAWWGNTIWYMFFFLVFSFAPIRKYYGTQTITPDMIRCFKFSLLLEFIGSLILFLDILGGSVTDPIALWLLLGLFIWPAVLVSVVCFLIWRDRDWKTDPRAIRILKVSFKSFIGCGALAFIFADPKVAFILLLLSTVGFISLGLLQVWSENGFYLPLRYQYMMNTTLNAGAIVFAALTLVVSSNASLFFCLSVAFGSYGARLVAEFLALSSTISRSTPLYFSSFIFPIYSLDPITNDLVEQNCIGVLLYKIQFVFFLWGSCCVIFIHPLDIGVGIVAFAFGTILTFTSYLVSRTPIWMSSATLCIDEKELKETAKQARLIFEKRRSNFEIICDEYEAKDKEEARLQQQMDRYAAWGQKKKTKTIEFEKRYSAKEMVDVCIKARRKLNYDRLGNLRRDRVLAFKDTLRDAFYTGRGPFSPLVGGGLLLSMYNAYKDPASLRRKKEKPGAKKKKNAKVLPAGKTSNKIILGEEDESDEDDDDEEKDQLDMLVEGLGPGGDVLKVTVKDYDDTSANDELGYVEIQLDELAPDELHIGWHELESSAKKVGTKEEATGKIQLQVEVANVFGEEDLQVRVTVIRANGLRAADRGGTSDPFCELECGTFKCKTAIIFKTLSPEWADSRGGGRFTFPPVDNTLMVEIKDKDVFSSDSLGGVDIFLPDLPLGEEVVQSYELEGGHGKTRATGTVKLALLLTGHCPVSDYGLKAAKASLQVTIISAKGIRAADRGGTSDPFCVVKCGLDVFSTSVINKTLTPKWMESYTFNEDPHAGEEEEEDEFENMEMLDCWKVYQQLPKLDVGLAREYEEEMRANTLFQLLVVVASEGRKSKEAILFQRFLREYRFKLLANKIEPPKNIFKSKSWATCDVGLVALWLLRLTPEQRERFYALKAVFKKEVDKTEEKRMQEDKEYGYHGDQLLEWQRGFDYEKGRKQLEDFEARRQRRSTEMSLLEEPEIVINAKEMLEEISNGPSTVEISMEVEDIEEEQEEPGPEVEEEKTNGEEEKKDEEATEKTEEEKKIQGENEEAKKEEEEKLPEGEEEPKATKMKTITVKMFQDPDFPAAPSSVAGIANEFLVEGWKRAHEIRPDTELFAGGTDPDDVFQGILHNGWFLSAMSILAASGSVGDDDVDPLIDNLFISKSKNTLGAYALRLYKNSQWEIVIVDDQFPVLNPSYATEKNRGVACSYSQNFEEMWVSLIEKAFAKYYGTYSMLENGYVHHALKTLTGYDSEEIFLLEATQGPARTRLWQKLKRFSQNGFLMGCGTITNNSANAEQMDSGLVFGSCYAIYQVRSVDGHKLLQLRNPPGEHGEWKGDWGDDSPLWSIRLKQKLGWTNDADDGTFWMSFDDFCLAFRSLYVCHYYDPSIWKNIKIESEWKGKTAAGLPCKHNADCKLHRNPQWVLDVQRPVDIHIKVSQIKPDGSMSDTAQPFAILLFRTNARRERHVHRVRVLSRNDVVDWTGKPDRMYEKHLYATLSPGFYVLMVATYDKDLEGPFQIHLDSSFGIGVNQLYPKVPEEVAPRKETAATVSTVDVAPEKKSLKQKIANKLEQKLEKAVAWGNLKKEKLEVALEKQSSHFHQKVIDKFGIDLKTIIPVQKGPDDSDDEDGDDQEDEKLGNDVEDILATAEVIIPSKAPKPQPEKKKPEPQPAKEEPAQPVEPSVEPVVQVAPTPATNAPPPDSPWVKVWDPASSAHYYWNKNTQETQWEEPSDFHPGVKDEQVEASMKLQALWRGKKQRQMMAAAK